MVWGLKVICYIIGNELLLASCTQVASFCSSNSLAHWVKGKQNSSHVDDKVV